MRRIHGVEDILLGFEPKDAGSIPAGSVFLVKKKIFQVCYTQNVVPAINFLAIEFSDCGYSDNSIRDEIFGTVAVGEIPCQWGQSFQERLLVKKNALFFSVSSLKMITTWVLLRNLQHFHLKIL